MPPTRRIRSWRKYDVFYPNKRRPKRSPPSMRKLLRRFLMDMNVFHGIICWLQARNRSENGKNNDDSSSENTSTSIDLAQKLARHISVQDANFADLREIGRLAREWKLDNLTEMCCSTVFNSRKFHKTKLNAPIPTRLRLARTRNTKKSSIPPQRYFLTDWRRREQKTSLRRTGALSLHSGITWTLRECGDVNERNETQLDVDIFIENNWSRTFPVAVQGFVHDLAQHTFLEKRKSRQPRTTRAPFHINSRNS